MFDLEHMFRIYSLLIGIAFGHFQTAYIFGRVFKKIDIRDHGSGSSGMTNANRVMGKKFGVPVLIIDAAKGFFAFVLCAYIFGGISAFGVFSFEYRQTLEAVYSNPWLPGLYGGLGAVLGHMFPIYMRFRGGKSIAAALGLVIALNPIMALITFGVWGIVVMVTRYVSLASIVGLIMLPVMLHTFFMGTNDGFMEIVAVGYFLTVLITYKHKDNIKRLLNGNENKLGTRVKIGDK
ncbi:MAG: glycerol-3-phosphate 1-O-acyltransferase PlsY [Defluviitaleaceae bacterium]|nr:glycerol-3-phosphate 1-O-acyltransferase PlsY [Defluviitaleaceae bacterium]